MPQQFELGALQSPDDFRDHIAEQRIRSRLVQSLPESLNLSNDMLDVRNQGHQGTCAAQTAAAIREWQETREMGLSEYLSPQFVYNLRSNYPSAGMYGRDAMNILLKHGICRDQTYKYGIVEKSSDIPESVKKESKNHVIKEYARVTTQTGLKRCLFESGPCYISFPVYNYGGRFWYQTSDEKMIGGHAVTVVGYNKLGFIIRNSWGSSWNTDGYTIYTYEDWGRHWEIWTVLDADTPDDIDYTPTKKGCCTIV